MPRFVFKLDPLLRLRHHEERQKQREVAEIERQRRELEATLRRRQRRLGEAKATLRGQLTGTLDAHDLRLYANAALQEMRSAQRTVIELAGVHKRLEQARAALAEAAARRRGLEELRARRRAAWRAAEERKEVAALDELAVMRRQQRNPT